MLPRFWTLILDKALTVHPTHMMARLREDSGFTVRQVAAKLQISKSAVSSYASTKSFRAPPLFMAFKLFSLFKASDAEQLAYLRATASENSDYAAVAGAIQALDPADDEAELEAWRAAARQQKGNDEPARAVA